MKNFKNLFFLSILLVLFSISFVAETQAQNSKDNEAGIVFNSKDMSQWRVAQIPARLPDGDVLLATFKADGTQIIAKVRRGVVVQIGEQPRGGSFKAVEQQRSPYCVAPNCGYSYSYIWCYIYPYKEQLYCYCLCMGDFTTGG